MRGGVGVGESRLEDLAVAVEPSGDGETAPRDRGPLILVCLVVVAMAVRVAVFARPIATLDRLFVSDDTYYTLTIARSMAHGFGPTTDGHTLTSGFQPLLGFLMIPVFWFTHNPDVGLRADMALLLAADVGVVVCLFWLGRRLAGLVGGAVAGFIWALSPNAISMALGGLETTLAVFAALGLVVVWLCAWDRPSRARWAAVGVVAGLAVLARVDVLGLVAALAVVHLLWGRRRELIPAAVGLAVTLAPWWGYCLVEFGTPIPTSGSATRAFSGGGSSFSVIVKSVAGSTAAFGPITMWSNLQRNLVFSQVVWPYWAAIAAFIALGGIAIGGTLWRRERRHPATMPPALWAGALCVWAAALLLFYGWFNIPYYTSRYLTPVTAVEALLLGWAASAVVKAASRQRGSLRVSSVSFASVSFASVVLIAGAAAAVSASAIGLGRVLRAQQASEMHALGAGVASRAQGLFVARVVPDRVSLGALQSGGLSYFANPHTIVVNLDGVVNPDAARARRDGTLAEYMHRRKISWVADQTLFVDQLNAVLKGGRPPTHLAPVARHPETFTVVAKVAPGPGKSGSAARSPTGVSSPSTGPP